MITIPLQHYVGVKPERDTESTLPLAFATPFGADAAFEKRKATVDQWCRGHGRYENGKYVYDNVDAKVLDNGLFEGFRIAESVRRYGWNGGNVVWRVVDPRGFELEISSSNFARIIDCTTVVNGEIQGKCIWGRDGAANVLLPEASEPYQQATANTKRSAMKIDAKSLSVGDEVEFKDGTIRVYMGTYSFISRKEVRHPNAGYGAGYSYEYQLVVKKRQVFGKRIDKEYLTAYPHQCETVHKTEGDWSYYVIADTKNVSNILRKNVEQIVANDVADDMTTQFEHYSNVIDFASPDSLTFAAIPGVVKLSDVTLSLEPAIDGDYTKFVQHGRTWCYAYTPSYARSDSGTTWNLCVVDVKLNEQSYVQHNHVSYTITDINSYCPHNLVATHNNKQYRI